MVIDDIRKTFEAVIGQLSPSKAQQLAKRYLEPGAAKEQVAKTAGEVCSVRLIPQDPPACPESIDVVTIFRGAQSYRIAPTFSG